MAAVVGSKVMFGVGMVVASVIEVTASVVVPDGVVGEDAVVLAAVSDAGVFDPVIK